jgi:C_GCAxxG_C_C family probable redox protein
VTSAQESSREELLSKIEETARNYEIKNHGCSRCVLRSLQKHLNLGDSSVFVASTPLAGGICMIGDTCGALLGGVLAIGLATASEDFENEKALFASLAEGYRFYRKFVKKMGSARCRDIQVARLGYFVDLTNLEAYNKAKQAGMYQVCGKFVGEAARLAAEHILGLQCK